LRINKFLAFCGFGSRRSVETIILDGKVSINGEVCRELSWRVDPLSDKVEVDGKLANYNDDKIYLMINKPPGYLVSHKDDFERKLVYNLLPNFGMHLFAVGRLDYQSQGLLLLTSDGDFANKVIHPRYKLEKVYKVNVDGYFDKEMWLGGDQAGAGANRRLADGDSAHGNVEVSF